MIELRATHAGWHAAEWLDSTPVFTKRRFDSFLRRSEERERSENSFANIGSERPGLLALPPAFGPLARLDGGGGHVRFLVHCPLGTERIYYLECTVHGDGRVDCDHGETAVEIGGGYIY